MTETSSQIEYYARALRAPRMSDGFRRLGDQARGCRLVHEEYLTAVLSREVPDRGASGAATRIKAARFPAHKDLEEFRFDHQPSADRNLIAHLGTGVFLSEPKNVVLFGPPGTGKTHLTVGIGIGTKAAKAGQRVPFDSATGWVARLQEAHSGGKLAQELVELCRSSLLIVIKWAILRSGRREPVLSARIEPLRIHLDDPDVEPPVRPVGRCLRRPQPSPRP